MTWFQLKQWWHHCRHALSRHGVHSPFVYNLIDNGLHRKKGTVETRLRNYFHSVPIVTEVTPAEATTALQQATDTTIILVKGIHNTPEAAASWQALCNTPSVTMSIDLLHLGLLFFRKEFKVKQHFILRRYGR